MKYSLSATLSLPYLRLHQWLYERSGGLVGRHVGGRPTLLLTTMGRRSGVPRTVALIYAVDGDDYIVVASNGGADSHPGWYWNIQDDSSVIVQVGTKQTMATATVATGEQRARLWALANRNNQGLARMLPGVAGRFDAYQRHTDRTIDVVIVRSSTRSSVPL